MAASAERTKQKNGSKDPPLQTRAEVKNGSGFSDKPQPKEDTPQQAGGYRR